MSNFTYARSYRGPLKAALFDWAGTTMDYGCRAPAVVFVEVFKRHGVEITMEEARLPMGAAKKQHIREISEIPRVAGAWQDAHGKACAESDIEAMYEQFIPMQLDCLAEYSQLIPGTNETIAACRERGMKIGSNTGYNREMTEIILAEGAKQGYVPDSTVCATDVAAGRPAPWMSLKNAHDLGIYPMEAIVKVGDTLPDIAEGLNAGMWTIGLAKTGNEIGLTEKEIAALDKDFYARRLARAHERMQQCGAHYVVDGIGDILPCLDDINARLARGERP